jgi:hypothetical protein
MDRDPGTEVRRDTFPVASPELDVRVLGVQAVPVFGSMGASDVLAAPPALVLDGLAATPDRLPATLGGLGESVAAYGVPVTLEWDAGLRHKCGRGSTLRFRLRAAGLGQPVSARVTCSSRFLETAITSEAALEPSEEAELPAVRFVPRVAADEIVELTVELGVAGASLGRYRGSLLLRIEEDVAKAPISAGGDVIIMGAEPNPAATLDVLRGMGESWQAVPLREDAKWRRRLQNALPAVPSGRPVPPPGRATSGPLHALVTLVPPGGAAHVMLVTWASSCGMGRGGVPQVRWLVGPVVPDPRQEGRLSRCHAVFHLRRGRAWVRDESTNGVWIGDERTTRGQDTLLCAGDVVHLAHVLALDVHLFGGDGAANGLMLLRRDVAGVRLSYMLTDNRAAFSAPTDDDDVTGPWLAWRGSDEGPQLAVWDARATQWLFVAAKQRSHVAGSELGWRVLEEPLAQAQCLGPELLSS